MTNIEYYGFKNLYYETNNFNDNGIYKITEIYYVPKHNKKELVLLARFITSSQKELVREKTKWLLSTPDVLAKNEKDKKEKNKEEEISEKDLEVFAEYWLISA